MDKRSIIFIAVLIALIVFYFPMMEMLGLYTPAEPAPVAVDTTTQELAQPDQITNPVNNTVQQQQLSSETNSGIIDSSLALLDSAPANVDSFLIRTNKYEMILSSFGGGPVSILLNDYNYRDGNRIQMLPEAETVTPEAVFAGGTFSASRINYSSDLNPGEYDANSSPLEITFTHSRPEGGQIIKHYTFYPDSYNYDLTFTVNDPSSFGFERKYQLNWNTPLGLTEPQAEIDYQAMTAVAMMSGERVSLDDFDNDVLNQSLDGSTTWAGLRSKYFAAVLIPQNRPAEAALAEGKMFDVFIDGEEIEKRMITAGLDMPFADVNSFTDSFSVYVGPLDYTIMSDYNNGLEDILGIGTTPFIGWLIKPFAIGIIWLLPRLYDFVPNYGIVIILFALLIKLITMPLSMKSFKSMQAMKELQPKIDELKKKHKKNPQDMNKEMMAMYKKHGVSPASGCLPMLPQMPLFFAMFSVFRETILLRDAPFVWFIDDLSRGATGFTDPYIILVVLMIASQFISQKLTMASNQQNKALMYMMPLFMGFIFYKFAAGLVLYWACFSAFSLIDYFVFKRNKKNQQVQTL